MFSAVTSSIVVTVEPSYAERDSSPEEGRYLWHYRVVIENRGERAVQLMHRRWTITDSLGRVKTVTGSGVVGQQPVIEPGEAFEYASACPLSTPGGFMTGSYRMVDDLGVGFDVTIPVFSLDVPDPGRRLN